MPAVAASQQLLLLLLLLLLPTQKRVWMCTAQASAA
jgi:hypothetical protein